MNYANQRRYKIFVRIEVSEAGNASASIAKLENPDYKAKAEGTMILKVEALDWNCLQQITPLYH